MTHLLYVGHLVGSVLYVDFSDLPYSDCDFSKIDHGFAEFETLFNRNRCHLDESRVLVAVWLVGRLKVDWNDPLVMLRVLLSAVIELNQLPSKLGQLLFLIETLLRFDPSSLLFLQPLLLELLLSLLLSLQLLLLLLSQFLACLGLSSVLLGISLLLL